MNNFAAGCVALIALVSVAQIYGLPNDPHMKAVAEKCQASEHATPADMQALMTHSLDLTKEAKCVIACVMKECEALTDDGKINKDVFMKHAKEMAKGDATMMQHADEIYEACHSQSDPDLCELAYKFAGCMTAEMVARKIDMNM